MLHQDRAFAGMHELRGEIKMLTMSHILFNAGPAVASGIGATRQLYLAANLFRIRCKDTSEQDVT